MTHSENTSASRTDSISTGNGGGTRAPKAPLAPDLRRLDERSVRAWTEAMAVTPLGGGEYAVEGESGNRYVVDLPAGDCTCPDHSIRGERCKHIRRTAIMVNRHELPPPGRLEGTCVACERERVLPEAGPALCDDCRPEPGDFATDRETGDTLLVARVTADRADAVEVDATGQTVADYPTNDGYPRDDLVVEVVYPFSGKRGQNVTDLPRYSFPLSRLSLRDQQLLDRDWR